MPVVKLYAAVNHACSPGLVTPSPPAMYCTGATACPRPARHMNCAMTTTPMNMTSWSFPIRRSGSVSSGGVDGT